MREGKERKVGEIQGQREEIIIIEEEEVSRREIKRDGSAHLQFVLLK